MSCRRSMRCSASLRPAWSTVCPRTRSTAPASPTPSTTRPPGRHRTQYFEIMGSRSIYHDGWMASAFGPRIPWVPGPPAGMAEWTPDHDVWELYNLDDDWTQAHDLAAEMPDKLAQMKETFAIEAAQEQRLPRRWRPLDPRLPSRAADLQPLPGVELHRRHHPDARVLRPRPRQPRQPSHHRRRHTRQRRAACCTRSAVPAAVSPATSTTAYLCYEYNLFILMRTKIRSAQRLPAGPATIQIDTDVPKPRPGSPSSITMTVNGDEHRHWQRARSARHCCSPPTTASTSAPASADPSRSTTTTARPSPSTGTSTP